MVESLAAQQMISFLGFFSGIVTPEFLKEFETKALPSRHVVYPRESPAGFIRTDVYKMRADFGLEINPLRINFLYDQNTFNFQRFLEDFNNIFGGKGLLFYRLVCLVNISFPDYEGALLAKAINSFSCWRAEGEPRDLYYRLGSRLDIGDEKGVNLNVAFSKAETSFEGKASPVFFVDSIGKMDTPVIVFGVDLNTSETNLTLRFDEKKSLEVLKQLYAQQEKSLNHLLSMLD